MCNSLLGRFWPALESDSLAGGNSHYYKLYFKVHGEQNSPSGEYLFFLWCLEERTDVVRNFSGSACPHLISVLIAVKHGSDVPDLTSLVVPLSLQSAGPSLGRGSY